MKRVLWFVVMLLCFMNCYSSDDNTTPVYPINPNAIYQLYPTQNMWTFLKLNTTTGEIWIVQYSVGDGNDTFEYPLSIDNQNLSSISGKPGKYVLYPTRNFFNFIMLDTEDGRTWQVQWNTKKEDRMVRRIYKSYTN